MTHSSLHSPKPYRELEKYFFRIVSTQPKELTMLDVLKAKWNEFWTTRYEFVEESPIAMEEDYWAFEMYTDKWIDELGEEHPEKHTVVINPHEGTWMDVLDEVLAVLDKHYGYSVTEQVYYSVTFPMNEYNSYTGKPFAGYGRSLNDEVLQQLLLAHPEVYATIPFADKTQQKGIFE